MDFELLASVGLLLTLLALWWGTLWLILASGSFDESPRLRRLLGSARAWLGPLPLLWLGLYAALILRAWRAAGEWPRLEEFDFSSGWTANVHASAYPVHLMVLDGMGAVALASILLFLPFHAAVKERTGRSRAILAVFTLSFLLTLFVTLTEGPANAANWLAYTR